MQLNHLRHAIVLAALLAALEAFSLLYVLRGRAGSAAFRAARSSGARDHGALSRALGLDSAAGPGLALGRAHLA